MTSPCCVLHQIKVNCMWCMSLCNYATNSAHSLLLINHANTTSNTTTGVIEAREDQLTIALAVTIPLLCLGNVVLVIAICICLIKRRMKNKKYNKFYW